MEALERMPELVAQGPRRQQRWRKRVPQGIACKLGRRAGVFSAGWDASISRQHVTLLWNGTTLAVELLANVTNPMFFAGKQVTAISIRPGEHFVLGETTFSLVDESAHVGSDETDEITELTFSVQHLRHHPFGDPSASLEILSRLPEEIAGATGDEAVYETLVRMVFEGLSRAECVALCALDTSPSPVSGADAAASESPDTAAPVRFLYWDRTGAGALQVSQRLIGKAVQTGQTIVHTWERHADDATSAYTLSDNMTWAFATPFQGGATRGWALYVAGGNSPDDRLGLGLEANPNTPLHDELKFAEIVVSTVGSFMEVRELQRRQSVLGQFFSQPVISALAEDEDPNKVLAPREVELTALFCDLRGFSMATEQQQHDLLGLLQRVSDALGILTHHILQMGGVIGDFHGDAAMGFWGWPLAQSDVATRAAKAAIEIVREMQRVESLLSFRVGIGIASGPAVAGKIGTVDQVKVTAFGPAVNLASRLEMLTKRLNTTILADGKTASQVDRASGIRPRRLAVVQPYGMSGAIDLWELLPPQNEGTLLADDDIAHYENSLVHFIQGDWETAWELLHLVPAGDRSKDFLTTYIASRNRRPPEGWDGVIRLDSK